MSPLSRKTHSRNHPSRIDFRDRRGDDFAAVVPVPLQPGDDIAAIGREPQPGLVTIDLETSLRIGHKQRRNRRQQIVDSPVLASLHQRLNE